MESSMPENEIDHEFLPYLRVYKGGCVERFVPDDVIPASVDPSTGVSSKDVVLSTDSGVSVRLYLPPSLTNINHKLPLLIYFHGGAFLVASPFISKYHHLLNSLVAEANVIAVSVDYRRAPEHPIPVCYDDSWAALQWALSHSSGQKDEDQTEPWLKNHADFDRVFLAGDSSGANIAHNLAMRVRAELGVELLGLALVHPYFWGSEPIGSEATVPSKKSFVDRIWPYVCPSNPDNDDPRINPMAADGPTLVGLGCTRVLVFVAGKDVLRDRGWLYYETLAKSGWSGVVEITETEEEDHVFHIYRPESEKARDLVTGLAQFLNLERPTLP
ncbi:probable carboxylesterase 2 [Macadamia integrifolia]|uniref:probable carboxylesterase 2 n=1 Tax=Macadamia integrifolia TaxID=60698 RepID=UPI001C4FED6E|nr:probable carboxylesterase 2 [Macadamia integrifolia]